MENGTIQEPRNDLKKRHNLTFDEQTRSRAVKLAKEDDRSLAGVMRWLVNQEWKRRHPEAETANAQ